MIDVEERWLESCRADVDQKGEIQPCMRSLVESEHITMIDSQNRSECEGFDIITCLISYS